MEFIKKNVDRASSILTVENKKDFSQKDIKAIEKEFPYISTIRFHWVTFNMPLDFSSLTNLTDIRLSFCNNSVDFLNYLKGIPSLKHLKITFPNFQRNIKNINFLENIPELEVLILQGFSEIFFKTELFPKRHLKNMKEIYIISKKVYLEGIGIFQNLTDFSVSGVVDKDFLNLSCLSNLIKLKIKDSFMYSLNEMDKLKKLMFLQLLNSGISIIDFPEMPLLKVLYITGEKVKEVRIDSLKAISSISINNTSLEQFNISSQISNLTYLNLRNNLIKKFEIAGYYDLQYLNLSNNNLEEIDKSLDMISGIKVLHL